MADMALPSCLMVAALGVVLAISCMPTQGELAVESHLMNRLRNGLYTHSSGQVPRMSMGYAWPEGTLPVTVERPINDTLGGGKSGPLPRNRLRRQAAAKPDVYQRYLRQDANPRLQMYWTGSGKNGNSSTLIIRTYSTFRVSMLYFSRDYGRTFMHVAPLLPNGFMADISHFESSRADPRAYVFVDQTHQYIFTSNDDRLETFWRQRFNFPMQFISSHPSNPKTWIALDRHADLYVTFDFCKTWKLMTSNVHYFKWGIKGIGDDTDDTLYIQSVTASVGIVRSDDFFTTEHSVVTYAQSLIISNRYMFVLKQRDTTVLMVSHDRKPFRPAVFPDAIRGTPNYFHEYFLADTTDNQVFMVGYNKTTNRSALFVSEINGISYTLSLNNFVYRSRNKAGSYQQIGNTGQFYHPVEWHRVGGLSTVFLASRLSGKSIHSTITFDAGGVWEDIQVDGAADGKPLPCATPGKCSLHLDQNLPSFASQYFVSGGLAPGIVMTMGNYGPTLTTSDGLYVSSNAGYIWEKALSGKYYFTYGDHGGIMVAVQYPYNGFLTNVLWFSRDYGQTWEQFKFRTSPMRFYGILVEPGFHSTVFNIVGGDPKSPTFIVISVDFKKMLGPLCTTAQLVDWYPGDPANIDEELDSEQDGCLLGQREHFKRRHPDALCFIGPDYSSHHWTETCECTREDYECSTGFSPVGQTCLPAVSTAIYVSQLRDELSCQNPTATFDKGYRRVSGTKCIGGHASLFEPSSLSCPTAPNPINLFMNDKNITGSTLKLLAGQSLELRIVGADLPNTKSSKTAYVWQFSEDHSVQTSATTAKHTYSKPGLYQVTVQAVLGIYLRWASVRVDVRSIVPTADFNLSVKSLDAISTTGNSPNLLLAAFFADDSAYTAQLQYFWNVCGTTRLTKTPYVKVRPLRVTSGCSITLNLNNGVETSHKTAKLHLNYNGYTPTVVKLSDAGIDNALMVSWTSAASLGVQIILTSAVANRTLTAPGSVKKWLVSDLPAGLYHVQVRSVFASAFICSNAVSHRVHASKPNLAIPANVTIVSSSTQGVVLSWNAVPNAIRYEIAQISHKVLMSATTILASSCPKAGCVHSVQQADTVGFYFYKVRALDADDSAGRFSYTVGSRLPSNAKPLTAPTNLRLSCRQRTQSGLCAQHGRNLTWAFNAMHTSFKVGMLGPGYIDSWSQEVSGFSVELPTVADASRYHIYVAAKNGEAVGPNAFLVEVLQLANDYQVVDWTISPLGTSSVSMSWQPPHSSQLWISGYVVRVAGPFADDSTEADKLPAPEGFRQVCHVEDVDVSPACTVYDLTAGSVLWFSVEVVHDGDTLPTAGGSWNPENKVFITYRRFIMPHYGPVQSDMFTIAPVLGHLNQIASGSPLDGTSAWTQITFKPALLKLGVKEVMMYDIGTSQTEGSVVPLASATATSVDVLLWPSSSYRVVVLTHDNTELELDYFTPPVAVDSQLITSKTTTASKLSTVQKSHLYTQHLSSILLAIGKDVSQRWLVGYSVTMEGDESGTINMLLRKGVSVDEVKYLLTKAGLTTTDHGVSSWLSTLHSFDGQLSPSAGEDSDLVLHLLGGDNESPMSVHYLVPLFLASVMLVVLTLVMVHKAYTLRRALAAPQIYSTMERYASSSSTLVVEEHSAPVSRRVRFLDDDDDNGGDDNVGDLEASAMTIVSPVLPGLASDSDTITPLLSVAGHNDAPSDGFFTVAMDAEDNNNDNDDDASGEC